MFLLSHALPTLVGSRVVSIFNYVIHVELGRFLARRVFLSN